MADNDKGDSALGRLVCYKWAENFLKYFLR